MEEIGGAAVIGTREENSERKADAQATMERETLGNMTSGIVGAIAGGVAELRHPDDREAIHAASGIGAPLDNMIGALGVGGGNEPRLERPTERAINQHGSPTEARHGDARPTEPRSASANSTPAGGQHTAPAGSPHAEAGGSGALGNESQPSTAERQATPDAARRDASAAAAYAKSLDAFKAMLASGEYAANTEQLTPLVSMLRAHPQWGPLVADIADLELMAVIGYTGADYRVLNQALRGNNRELVEKIKPYVDTTVSGLRKLPDHKGTCFRGVKEASTEVLEKYTKGKIVDEPAFTSSSYERGAHFGGKLQFVIESSHAKKVDFLSLYPEQKEALFVPGTKFKVIEHDVGSDGTHYVSLREVE
jgi:hypothetical protein